MPRPLPPGEVEGLTVICGRFETPERHDRPGGRRISLAFAVLKARTQSPAPDPLIDLHGGPGGGAVRDLAGIVAPHWDPFLYDICEGAPPAPRSGYHHPVGSDIPTLVLYGLTDTQTSAAGARGVARSLTRARTYAVPESGHGALIFPQCVKDIGQAFIERPETGPDVACLDRLKPDWVLPPK